MRRIYKTTRALRRSAKVLPSAVRDSALRKIVRGQLDSNAIARDKTDEVFPHLASDMSYNLMAIFEFDTKLSTREGLHYRP